MINEDKFLELESRLKERESLKFVIDEAENKLNKLNTSLYIYESTIVENEHFKITTNFNYGLGFNVSMSEVSNKYNLYNIFGSFSWWNEYVKKIVNGLELARFYDRNYKDFDNTEELRKLISDYDTFIKDTDIVARFKLFLDYMTKDIIAIFKMRGEY